MQNRSQHNHSDLVGLALSERIVEALKDLQYGSVEIVIHDGRIVQIERREKWRVAVEKTAKVTRIR